MYQIELRHPELSKYRVIRGKDLFVVRQKAAAQSAQWEAMWARRQEIESGRSAKRAAQAQREAMKSVAEDRTADARAAIARLQGILKHTLGVNDRIDWNSLKDRTPYMAPPPAPPQLKAGREPTKADRDYTPRIQLLDHLLRWRIGRKLTAAHRQFQMDHEAWRARRDADVEATSGHEAAMLRWQSKKREYEEEQRRGHDAVDRDRELYLTRDPDAVLDYCDLVLSRSEYPDEFPQDYDLDYVASSKTVIVDYVLPSRDIMPCVKEVRFVASRDELSEVPLPGATVDRLFDDVVYQVILRTIHELFEADVVEALDAVVFNGWVDSISQATGRQEKKCIASVQVKRAEFCELDLARVDPKACFRKLKGVSAAKLHAQTAVAPIVSLPRDDKRFVQSQAVAALLDEGVNLAAMDWEDFEHLIREVFEKEFASGGAEVRVTRASRDGGVDAVILDPDPIRGGKIVIQAKRYTNTVGVSFVRDLYGTVMNEGATKGILVSTADFGPDAYEFAKGKPLTLMSGGNLLHLLERHGHKARIDLQEARAILRASQGTSS